MRNIPDPKSNVRSSASKKLPCDNLHHADIGEHEDGHNNLVNDPSRVDHTQISSDDSGNHGHALSSSGDGVDLRNSVCSVTIRKVFEPDSHLTVRISSAQEQDVGQDAQVPVPAEEDPLQKGLCDLFGRLHTGLPHPKLTQLVLFLGHPPDLTAHWHTGEDEEPKDR